MAINLLEPKVYNRISAGEVVERPASIVKELVENSIDAGANAISIEIEYGGIKKIQVIDNGCGIEKDDLVVAFKPHATSKIKNVEDLDEILSLGFRGEALASISSVCHVYLSSKVKGSDVGYSIKVDGGDFSNIEQVARQNGTTLICRDLFFNTPARAKFLRKPKIEEGEVTHLVEKFMLSHPEIAFKYVVDNKLVYNTIGSSMQDIIYTIYGSEVYDSLIEIDYQENDYRLHGFITKPKISKSNRTFQTLFVNGRYVENYLISSAVQGVYENFLMKGKFPVYVLKLSLPAGCVDVNVHPSKKEVKFENSNWIYGFVRRAIEKSLSSLTQIASFGYDEGKVEDLVNNRLNLNSEHNPSGFSAGLETAKKHPLSETEGSRYIVSIDDIEDLPSLQEVVVDKEPKEYVLKRKPMSPPNLYGVKLEDEFIEKNKLGSEKLIFDQSQSGLAYDIVNNDNKTKEKVETNKFLSCNIAEEMKILGTAFNTYIIVELQDEIYFIDQHAGHERILYDKLVEGINSHTNLTQDLLLSYDITLGAKEAEQMEMLLDELNRIGFKIENTGGFTYSFKSVPMVLTNVKLGNFVNEIVKEGCGFDKKLSEFNHEKLCQTACKHAIKGGDSLGKEQCAYLIEQVRKGVMLCPHGRPVVLKLEKKEIEKMFGRIV